MGIERWEDCTSDLKWASSESMTMLRPKMGWMGSLYTKYRSSPKSVRLMVKPVFAVDGNTAISRAPGGVRTE